MTAVSPSVDVFRVHSPAARAPANASTVAVTVVVGTVLTIKFTNWPVKLNGMGSGLKPAAFRVPLGLGVNSSSRVTEELRGGTQQALLASTSNWRRVPAASRLVVLCSFYLNSTPFQVQVEEPWPLLVWAQMPLHSIDKPIHTQFYRARSPYDYCDCKCGRICRGSSRWVPFSTIFRQTQMLDVNWCGCIHERLKFRRWKSCENLWVSNGFYLRSFWMTSVHGNIGMGSGWLGTCSAYRSCSNSNHEHDLWILW